MEEILGENKLEQLQQYWWEVIVNIRAVTVDMGRKTSSKNI